MKHGLLGGVDPSSASLAIVFPHPATPTYMFTKSKLGSPYTPANPAIARKLCRHFINHTLLRAVPEPAFRKVWIEAPVITGKASIKSTMVQAFVSGAIQAAFIDAGFEVQLVVNSSWKKEVLSAGNASKDQIKRYMKRHWPKLYYACHGDQDILDAAAIAVYGERMNGRPQGQKDR